MRTHIVVAMATGASLASAGAQAQAGMQTSVEAGQAAAVEAAALALARALDSRLTVWEGPGGRRAYATHCRRSRGGCLARVAALSRLMAEVAQEHGVDPFLLAAMAIRESGLNPFARGAAGEMGIVQLHPRGVGSRVRFVTNEAYRRRCARRSDACQREVLSAGAALLAQGMRRCASVEEALGAYNTGACRETGYSRRVLRERGRLVELAKQTDRPARDAEAFVD